MESEIIYSPMEESFITESGEKMCEVGIGIDHNRKSWDDVDIVVRQNAQKQNAVEVANAICGMFMKYPEIADWECVRIGFPYHKGFEMKIKFLGCTATEKDMKNLVFYIAKCVVTLVYQAAVFGMADLSMRQGAMQLRNVQLRAVNRAQTGGIQTNIVLDEDVAYDNLLKIAEVKGEY